MSDEVDSLSTMLVGEKRFQQWRQQLDWSNLYGTWGAWKNLAETLTGAWWRVDGQMVMIPVALCRAVEDIHDNISYVLIGGPMWEIWQRQWSWWRRVSFQWWRFNLEDLWWRQINQERTLKRFTNWRSWGSRKYQKDKTTRHKKIRALTLIPC